MGSATAKFACPVALICGGDDFTARKRAKELYAEWTAELGGMDHEIIDASASNSGEALRALGKLREALQTFPFFGSGKVVWFKDCNFLADDRTSGSSAVTEQLASMAAELKALNWSNLRLLINAGKVDKRKTFYKTLDKSFSVEVFEDWSEERDWADLAESRAVKLLRARNQDIAPDALAELVNRVGASPARLESELEKVSLHAGGKNQILLRDVEAVCTRNKSAQAFGLGEAFGDRDLPRLMRCLDEELWEIRRDKKNRSEIGLLYGLISKVRAMLLLKEMLREGWIKQETDYNRFKPQLANVPKDRLPTDRRYDPTAINPYILFKALPQARRYTEAELIRAMELLLDCNRQLVGSGLDETLVLQKALVQIVGKSASAQDVKLHRS